MFVEEKSKGEVPDFKLGTLKLSTAIRIGAAKRPQCTGRFFTQGGSCAWGAAYEAVGGIPGPSVYIDEIIRHFPAFKDQDGLRSLIALKNDNGESREAIADWLESQGL